MTTAGDFFPEADVGEWTFFEKSTLQRPSFSFRAQSSDGVRQISLDDPDHQFGGFFDRMTVTPDGLELNRIHFRNQVVDIPAWRLTLTPAPDRVDNVFSSDFDGQFGLIRSPFTGITTNKTFPASSAPGCWTVDLKISGLGGDVLEATLRFATKTGLCTYSGQAYGAFFFYERVDEPGCDLCL